MPGLSPADYSAPQAGGRRHRVTVKKMKKALKKAGLKTTGKRSTLTRRIKKAHLKMRGGNDADPEAKDEIKEVNEEVKQEDDVETGAAEGGRRRRSRKGSRKH